MLHNMGNWYTLWQLSMQKHICIQKHKHTYRSIINMLWTTALTQILLVNNCMKCSNKCIIKATKQSLSKLVDTISSKTYIFFLPDGLGAALDICNLNTRPGCENGGTCANAYHSFDQDVDYFCFCLSGFTGHNCEATGLLTILTLLKLFSTCIHYDTMSLHSKPVGSNTHFWFINVLSLYYCYRTTFCWVVSVLYNETCTLCLL